MIVRVRGDFCCVFSGHFPGKTVFIVRKSVFIVKQIPVITQGNLGTDWEFSDLSGVGWKERENWGNIQGALPHIRREQILFH